MAKLSNIEENIKKVRKKIGETAKGCGREESEITLVAATKYANADEINEAIRCGITDIGENRVQDLLAKYEKLDKVNLHFIGTLQTNKVKYIIDKVCLIHSVNSLHLAEEIDRQAKKIDKIQDILVEVNFFDEGSKSGIRAEDVYDFIGKLEGFSNIRVCGIMMMMPLDKNIVTQLLGNCNHFVLDIEKHFCNNMDNRVCIVSFGMSGDYEQAIKCGSTMVRIGSSIFKN